MFKITDTIQLILSMIAMGIFGYIMWDAIVSFKRKQFPIKNIIVIIICIVLIALATSIRQDLIGF